MTHYEISNKGFEGIMDSLSYDYGQSWRNAEELCGYPKERELSIAAEHKREIFEKVYQKRSK